MEPPLSEKELIGMFVDTLQGPYFNRLVSSGASGFADLVAIGDKIEKMLKDGKIPDTTEAPSTTRKFYGNFRKKQKGETNAISAKRGRFLQRRPQQPLVYQWSCQCHTMHNLV